VNTLHIHIIRTVNGGYYVQITREDGSVTMVFLAADVQVTRNPPED
jgi:hypothetical protein